MNAESLSRLVRQWRQRWRLTEMKLLFWALLVSVIAVTSVGFFTDRVDQAMSAQTTQLMGGDLVLESSRPIRDELIAMAQKRGIEHAKIVRFPSMVSSGDEFQLAMIKAVSEGYPLYGQLQAADRLDQSGGAIDELPQSGEVWGEARVFHELSAKSGDEVTLGQITVRLNKVLTYDPSRSNNVFQLAPTLIMPLADLERTGLLTAASRANFSVMFKGDASSIAQLKAEIARTLQSTEKLQSLQEGVPTVQQALQRAGRFLSLAALLSVILAGAAIALASASLMKRETRSVAVLKVLGQSRRRIVLDFVFSLLMSVLLATVLGVIIGYLMQMLLAGWMAQLLIDTQLPQPGFMPVVYGFLTALVMMAGFSAPTLWRLVDTAPIQILKTSTQTGRVKGWLMGVVFIATVFVLLWLQAGEAMLASWILGGILVVLLVFWLLGLLLLNGLARLKLSHRWRWLGQLRRSPRTLLLVVVFGVGFFSLLLMTMVRTELLDRWQQSVPEDAPNHFMINIQPNEVDQIKAFMGKRQVEGEFYPMIRGRLTKINDQPVLAKDYPELRAKRLLEREFNLSSAEWVEAKTTIPLPEGNEVQQGEWFNAQLDKGLSVEADIAQTLGFGMGDTLTFDIAGRIFTETITSIRSVRWDSLQPNFFVMSGPGQLDDMPNTHITSVHIPNEQSKMVTELVKQFPSVTVLDVRAIVDQVKRLIDQSTWAVQGIFFFTLLAGVVVLATALQSQKADRRREIAILKSLGMDRQTLKLRLLVEFMMIGALAGGLAGVLVMFIGNLFSYTIFNLEMVWIIWPIVMGLLVGAALVGGVGYYALRGLLVQSPMALLKE